MATLSSPVKLDVLVRVFREAAGALLDADVEFAVAGSFAVWARAGWQPPMVEDIDLALRERDVVRAARALHDAGFRIEVPPEGWLVKAFHPESNDVGEHPFVDLIHSMAGLPIDDEVLARATPVSITAMAVKCMSPLDMMTGTLLSIMPSCLDYTGVVEKARLLREQFSWDELEQRAQGSPAALVFFDIARRLGIDPRHATSEEATPMPIAGDVQRLSEETRAALRDLTG